MLNGAIFASGNGSNFQAIVDASKESLININIKLLICNNEEAYVINRALDADIDIIVVDYKKYPAHEIERMLLVKLKEYKIDYIFLAGYLRLLTSTLINKYPNKILNIHPSLLPKYKGLNAIEQAIKNKDEVIGVTVHYVDELLDNGQIIIQDSIDVSKMNTAEIYENIHQLEHKLYLEAINKVLEGL